jgi:3-oxoadipate enol-lactonase
LSYLELTSRLSIHYLEINPGGSPTVLLLHGLGANGSSWALQFPALEQAGFRVLAPDTRGFGQSSYPGGRLTISTLASDISALVENLQAGPVHAVGISMGGVIALQLALDNPSLVDKLLLANSFAHLRLLSPGVWIYFALRLLLVHTLGLPSQAKIVARRIFPRPDQSELRNMLYSQITQANPSGYRAAMRALARFNALPHLHEICIPTLVITGEMDTTVPAENQRVLSENLPFARHVFIQDAGHAVIVDQPDVFNRFMLDFLQSEE